MPNPPKVCGLRKPELDKGRDALDYLIKRTKEDPFFLVATCVHAGHIPYNYQQQFAELIMEMPEELRQKLVDPEFAYKVLTNKWLDGKKDASHAKMIAPVVAAGARCYYDTCGKQGCKKDKDLWEIVSCMEDVKGIGNKMLNLMLEYIGDKDAVAIDRHIGDFMCNNMKVYCPSKGAFKKGASIPEKQYIEMLEVFRRSAEECGLDPAELQVSAWLKKACEARIAATKMPRKRTLYLGRGKVMDCGIYMPKQKSLREWMKENW
jgi:hypothetical protein